MNNYLFKYVITGTTNKVIYHFMVTEKNFDSAYKKFKKHNKNCEIISAKIINLENLKSFKKRGILKNE